MVSIIAKLDFCQISTRSDPHLQTGSITTESLRFLITFTAAASAQSGEMSETAMFRLIVLKILTYSLMAVKDVDSVSLFWDQHKFTKSSYAPTKLKPDFDLAHVMRYFAGLDLGTELYMTVVVHWALV